MPRTPTGRPRGRPVGTGKLGEEVVRLTVRLPTALYARLEAFAAGRAYRRGETHLSDCARDALEHFLNCPYKQQTGKYTEQQDKHLILLQQTFNEATSANADAPDALEEMPLAPPPARVRPSAAPGVPEGFYLGRGPCKRGHTWRETGRALMITGRRHCALCEGKVPP